MLEDAWLDFMAGSDLPLHLVTLLLSDFSASEDQCELWPLLITDMLSISWSNIIVAMYAILTIGRERILYMTGRSVRRMRLCM
jgi:hypothetical protein